MNIPGSSETSAVKSANKRRYTPRSAAKEAYLGAVLITQAHMPEAGGNGKRVDVHQAQPCTAKKQRRRCRASDRSERGPAVHSVEGSLKTVAAVTGGDSTWGFWMKVTIAAVAA
jgi:hypothetical protein